MQILGTSALSFQIEQLLVEDSKLLIIISPYLKINNRLRARMTKNFKNSENVLFLYRENSLNNVEYTWLSSFSNVKLVPIENLHAKIYMNENRCLITSMNLYEYSQINNHEIGIMIESEHNRPAFLDVLEEIRLIIDSNNVNFDFDSILQFTNEYPMRDFFKNFLNKYGLQEKYHDDICYVNFCNWARTIVDFNTKELYQDKSAILRSINLDRNRYQTLEGKLTKEVFY